MDRYRRTLGKVTVNGTGAAVDGTNPGLKPWIADWLGGRALELAFALSVNEDQRLGVRFRGAVPGPSRGPTRALLTIFQGQGMGLDFRRRFAFSMPLCASPPTPNPCTTKLQRRVSPKKKPLAIARGFPSLVPGRGLEPPHLSAHGPEPCASTNSAIRA